MDTDIEQEAQQTSISINFEALPYKALISTLYRFAEFFSVQSLTFKCSTQMSLAEKSLISLVELNQKTSNITELSQASSSLLQLSHPLLWNCGFAWLTELSIGSNYVEVADFKGQLKTLQKWVI